MGWGQEIGLYFELQYVSFSMDEKVDVDQICIINVSLDERHPDGNLYPIRGKIRKILINLQKSSSREPLVRMY